MLDSGSDLKHVVVILCWYTRYTCLQNIFLWQEGHYSWELLSTKVRLIYSGMSFWQLNIQHVCWTIHRLFDHSIQVNFDILRLGKSDLVTPAWFFSRLFLPLTGESLRTIKIKIDTLYMQGEGEGKSNQNLTNILS